MAKKQTKTEYEDKPTLVESSMSLSKDGKWFIHKTIITNIKARAYVEKVLESTSTLSKLEQQWNKAKQEQALQQKDHG